MSRTVDVRCPRAWRFAAAAFLMVVCARPARAQTVAQLLAPNAQRSDLRPVLAAWGDDAVAPIVAAIGRETAASPVRLGVLMHALSDIDTPAGELGLRSLLTDTRPYVRGTAAKLLAERGARCSVPALATLLADAAEYSKTRDGQTLIPVTVGGVVSDALAQLTGVQPIGSVSEHQAQLAAWWALNQPALQCGGGQ